MRTYVARMVGSEGAWFLTVLRVHGTMEVVDLLFCKAARSVRLITVRMRVESKVKFMIAKRAMGASFVPLTSFL